LSGAIGSLAAKGLLEGVSALISQIANRNLSRASKKTSPDDPKYKEILKYDDDPISNDFVANIISSEIIIYNVEPE